MVGLAAYICICFAFALLTSLALGRRYLLFACLLWVRLMPCSNSVMKNGADHSFLASIQSKIEICPQLPGTAMALDPIEPLSGVQASNGDFTRLYSEMVELPFQDSGHAR